MGGDYETLLKHLSIIHSWAWYSDSLKEEDLLSLEASLPVLNEYLGSEYTDKIARIIDEYKKKGRITRALYFNRAVKEVSGEAHRILERGNEVICKIKPELKPNERALLLNTLQKLLITRKRLLTTLESDENWKEKSGMLLDEMDNYLDEIIRLCAWAKLTLEYHLYGINRLLLGDEKSTLSLTAKHIYNLAKKIMREYNIEEKEIEKFPQSELETEIEEKERIIKTLEEKNKSLKEQIEKLRKELEEAKIGALPIDVRAEIEKRDKLLEKAAQTLKSSHEWIVRLKNELKAKEEEIERLKREVKFYPRLREEDINLLDQAMTKFRITIGQRETLKNVEVDFNEVNLIFSNIYVYRLNSGEVTDADRKLLELLLSFPLLLKNKSPTEQPNGVMEQFVRDLYAKYTVWRECIKSQREKELQHLKDSKTSASFSLIL
jgi:hypothetical protein